MSERVGFIGLGAMGLGMAANLQKAGFVVIGYDPSAERQRMASEVGVTMVGSAKATAEAADTVTFCVVRTKDQALDVVLGESGILAAQKPLTIVMSSTLDPETVLKISEPVEKTGGRLIDATLSGGRWGADAGTLTLMVAGQEEFVELVRPKLEAISDRLYVVGKRPGAGQAAKLAVQISFCIQMLAAFEALQITKAFEIDEMQLMDILTHSVGTSWTTENWERVKPWWQFHRPGGDLEIQLKDLRSALEEADRENVSLPVSGLVFQLLREVWRDSPA